MYHFFAPDEDASTGKILLRDDNYNHIKNVLRMKPGEKMIVSDARDTDSLCCLKEYQDGCAVLEVLPDTVADAEMPVRIHLFQGLPKGDKLETVIQKSVELGVCSVIPVEMKRSIVKIPDNKKAARAERWQRLSEAAAKQSGRRIIPEVSGPVPFAEALKKAAAMDTVLVPYECAEDMNATRRLLSSLRPGTDAAVFIGPEGGFDPAEIEKLRQCGAHICTLGHRILRTETAGPAFLAMCIFALEDAVSSEAAK